MATKTSTFNVHAPKDSKEMMRLRDFRILQREASTLLSQAVTGDQSSTDLSEDVGEYLFEDKVDQRERVVLVHFDPASQQLTSLVTAHSHGAMLRITQTPEGQTIEQSNSSSKRTMVYNLASGDVTDTVDDSDQGQSASSARLVDSAMSINVHDPKTPAEMFLLRDFRKEQKTVHDWLATAVNPASPSDNMSETTGEYMCLDTRNQYRSEQVILVQFDPANQDKLTTFRRSTHDEMHVCRPDPENPKKTLFEATKNEWQPGERKMSYDPDSGTLDYQVNDNWLRLVRDGRT